MSVKDCDGHKLAYHPERVAAWLKGGIMPLHAEIGLTNRCNHFCKMCTLDWITHGKDILDTDRLRSILGVLAAWGVKSVYYAGEGEPTLHPDFADIIKMTKGFGLSVALSTNGSRYDIGVADKTLHNLSWIRFSLDTIMDRGYMKLHGVGKGALIKVLYNINDCVQMKILKNLDADIGVQALLMPETIPHLKKLVIDMKAMGVDNVQIKPCHNHPQSSHNAEIPQETYDDLKRELMELETDDFKVVFRTRSMERLLEARTYQDCHGFDFYVLINAKGDIVPCNVFYDKKDFIYGNIYDNSFYEIWTGERRKNIIRKISESKFSMCGDYRCRLDVMNRHLQRVKYPEKNDDFI